MKRFFGMMPSSEVKISKTYKDRLGLKITIDSGEHGRTIIYSDDSTEYKDVEGTAEENFENALNVLSKHFDLKELTEL